MLDARAWLDTLTRTAPRTDRTMLIILSRLLSDDDVSTDALLIVADALQEAAMVAMMDDRLRDAGEIQALSRFVEREAGRARPGFW